MKKGKSESLFQWRSKHMHGLLAVLTLCLFIITAELPRVFVDNPFSPLSSELKEDHDFLYFISNQPWKQDIHLATESKKEEEEEEEKKEDNDVQIKGFGSFAPSSITRKLDPSYNKAGNAEVQAISGLQKAAYLAWQTGFAAWEELEAERVVESGTIWQISERDAGYSCPESVSMSGKEFEEKGRFMGLPCGIMVGSSLTIIGKPRAAHLEYRPGKNGVYSPQEVSQFIVELHGIKENENQEPPRVLHINPRLKGDWSNNSVIELNNFYKGQWGPGQRCDGNRSLEDETVDGFLKCETWAQSFGADQVEPKRSWWFQSLIQSIEKPEMKWQYPLTENHFFALTIRTGWEGFHVTIDGRHATSFPHHMGNLDKNTIGISINGDVDLDLLMASSLPSSHPKSLYEELFSSTEHFRAPPLPDSQADVFIGILSESSHFSERMAVRKTWMQSQRIKSSNVVARFFVALHSSKSINLQIAREAHFYGDMVIVPFTDQYDLVVLKTVAICEYGVRNVSTRYILKCDDDTFVNLDAVVDEVKKVGAAESIYLGSINMYHRPLRTGKWAVTLEEWPDEVYPFYANGAGYIISHDIAEFIVFQHEKRNLEIFKMEDVSMGLWVMQFNTTNNVKYVNTWRFCQDGCQNGCVAAHHQSPSQMLCMWKKFLAAKVFCCNG